MIAGDKVTDRLPAGSVLTVTSTSTGVGYVVRYGALTNLPDTGFMSIAGANLSVGPFGTEQRFEIRVDTGIVSYSMAPFDPALNERVPGNDVVELYGAVTPVDYTDGTPPATGEGVAGPGSTYTDYVGAQLYINAGTKAEPIWKIFQRSA